MYFPLLLLILIYCNPALGVAILKRSILVPGPVASAKRLLADLQVRAHGNVPPGIDVASATTGFIRCCQHEWLEAKFCDVVLDFNFLVYVLLTLCLGSKVRLSLDLSVSVLCTIISA